MADTLITLTLCRMILTNYFNLQLNCLHLILSDYSTSLPADISRCLMEINTALIITDTEDDKIKCDGSIVVTNASSSWMEILPNSRRTAIFLAGNAEFTTNLKVGCDILIIDGFPDYDNIRISSPGMNRTITLLEEEIEAFNMTGWWEPPSFQVRDPFRIACFNITPFVYVNRRDEAFDGIDYEIAQLITRGWPVKYIAYNFTPYANMFQIIMDSVKVGVNDMAIGSIWMAATFESELEVTHAYTEVCSTFLVPKPREIDSVWFVYRPLNRIVWILIGITTSLVAIIIYLYSKNNNFSYYLIESIRIVTNGAVDRISGESHAIFITWLLVCLILTTGYSAGFSSILTYPKYQDMNTIGDMVDRDIHWGSTKVFVKEDLSRSTYGSVRRLAENFILEEDLYVKNNRVKSNKYAVTTKRLSTGYITDTELLDEHARSNLKVLSECYLKNALVFVLQGNSPFKNDLNRGILRVSQSGLVDHLSDRILNRYDMFYMRQFYTIDNRSGYIPIGLIKLQGILYLLVIGWVLASFIFLVEIW